MSPGRTRGPAAGCAGPQAGLAPARPGIKVKAGNKPAGISAQQPASPVPAGTGRSGAEGKAGGQRDPPCLGRLRLSFSLPNGVQGCC